MLKSFQQTELNFEWKRQKRLAGTWQTFNFVNKRKNIKIVADGISLLFLKLFI
jgi:hypothetical protein